MTAFAIRNDAILYDEESDTILVADVGACNDCCDEAPVIDCTNTTTTRYYHEILSASLSDTDEFGEMVSGTFTGYLDCVQTTEGATDFDPSPDLWSPPTCTVIFTPIRYGFIGAKNLGQTWYGLQTYGLVDGDLIVFNTTSLVWSQGVISVLLVTEGGGVISSLEVAWLQSAAGVFTFTTTASNRIFNHPAPNEYETLTITPIWSASNPCVLQLDVSFFYEVTNLLGEITNAGSIEFSYRVRRLLTSDPLPTSGAEWTGGGAVI